MTDQLSTDLESLRIPRQEQPKRRSWLGWILALAVVGGGAWGVRGYAIPYAKANLIAPEVTLTDVSTYSSTQAQVDLTSTGYVVPETVSKVGAKIVGRVSKSNVKEWGEVKAGQVLFVLDPTEQKGAIASAQARAAAASARAQAARAQAAEVNLQWEREKRLAATGAVGQSTAEDLGARFAAMTQSARAAEAEAAAAQAEVTSMQANLADLTVMSPNDGIASTKPAAVGDVVRPDQTMVEISDLRTLMVEVDVPEAHVEAVKPGGPCAIQLDAFAGKRYRGVVAEVSPVLDRAKATAKVKVRFVDAADGVRGQMAARVSFLADEVSKEQMAEVPKKVIPAAAVIDRDGRKVAFRFDDGKLSLVPVTLGPVLGGGYELTEGPPPGTRLVSNPSPELQDGQTVKEKK